MRRVRGLPLQGAHGGRRRVFPRRLLSVGLALPLVAGCTANRHRAASGSTVAATTTTTTTVPPTTTTTVAHCTALGVVQQWPLRQRVMRLIAAPSFDFNLPQLGSVVAEGIGGVLFIGSAAPPADLARVVAAAQAKPVGGVPVLTMADEEGGGIQRLNGPVVSFAWPRQLAAGQSVAQVQSLARTVGGQLRAAGVDLDLAPVLDVDGGAGPNNEDPDGSRSFSAVPSVAASYGVAFMRGLASGGEVSVVKHFLGLGGSTGNSDVGPAHTLAYSALQASGIPPFRSAVAAGARAVMVANDTVPGLTTTPASLSSTVIQGVLRQQLGFRGAVLTDSLSADAITSAGYGVVSASVAAVEAGADLVLFGSTLTPATSAALIPGQVAATVNDIADALVAAVQRGALPESQVDASVLRVVGLSGTDLCASA